MDAPRFAQGYRVVILESIVTTISENGTVNIAPMGPIVNDMMSPAPEFLLRPFAGSQTHRNLLDTRRATIHVTDDALLFARSAIGRIDEQNCSVRLIHNGDWAVLEDCHRWFAVDITEVLEDPARCELTCSVMDSGIVRPFFGFNRAMHAVIEAAILATRTQFLPADSIRAELCRLQPLVDKTAGPREFEAFEILQRSIDEKLHSPN